ncbi:MAG: MarR family winged helix-turn-helix transcriptional regulator [Dermatophilaceae bacterium]
MAWLLRRLDVARRVNEQPVDLGAADLRLLWLLSDGRPRTLADVAHELGLEQSTVNRQVHAALDQQLVCRYRDAGQTAWLLAATLDGTARFESAVRLITGAYENALGYLDPTARAQFVDGLRTFVEGYEALMHS